MSHILNAAEFRGVNVGEDYFGSGFQYMGLRVEDTPQTQICRSEPRADVTAMINDQVRKILDQVYLIIQFRFLSLDAPGIFSMFPDILFYLTAFSFSGISWKWLSFWILPSPKMENVL